jgi:uncharacterized protein YbjT (DUF2867 family)
MKVVVFGATGMVGQGTLLECLDDRDVHEVVSVVRRPSGKSHPKLREIVHADFFDFHGVGAAFDGVDACLFCLGTSSAGMSEAEYTKITADITLAAARVLLAHSPGAAFCYVSGAGTDANSRMMWARVKGTLENQLLAMFQHAYLFRPGYIHPERGVTSSTGWLRVVYAGLRPLYPVMKKVIPSGVTDSVTLGRAMLRVVKERGPSRVLESVDINSVGAASNAVGVAA